MLDFNLVKEYLLFKHLLNYNVDIVSRRKECLKSFDIKIWESFFTGVLRCLQGIRHTSDVRVSVNSKTFGNLDFKVNV